MKLCTILEQNYMEYILVKNINNNNIINKYFNRLKYLDKFKSNFYDNSIILFTKALNSHILSLFSKKYSFNFGNLDNNDFTYNIYKLNYYFEKIDEYKSKYYILKNLSKYLNNNMLDIIKIIFKYNDIEFRNIFFKKYKKEFLDIISFSNDYDLEFLFLFGCSSDNIIVLLNYFSNLYSLSLSLSSSNFKYIIISCFDKLVNTQSILNNIPQICKYINNNILNSDYNLNNLIIQIIVTKIKFYDEIFTILENDLVRRLMFHNSNLEIENNFLKILKDNFTSSTIYKYKEIIENFYNSKNNNILLLNKNVWNLNYDDGCHIVESFKNLIFDDVAKLNYSNINFDHHNFVYFLHLGYVDIKFYSKDQNLNLRMLPIHLYILQLLEKNIQPTSININYIHEKLPNYSLDFLSTIMESFLKIKLLELKNNNYVINLNYNKNDISLIKVFNEINNTEIKEDIKIQIKIANNKSDILCTIINHLVKLDVLSREELYDKCYNHKKPFELTKDIYDSCMENMIKKDYIYIKENMIIKSL